MRELIVEDRVKYIRDLFAFEDEILKEIVARTIKLNLPIQIGAEEGKLLQFIIKSSGVKNIIEIGTLAGYSTIWMARALPDDGKIITIERNKERLQMAKDSFSNLEDETAKKIELLHGSADEVLQEISKNKETYLKNSNNKEFDMIFIDADKISYEKYLDWAEENIKKGGIIIGDNTYLFEAVYMNELPEGVRPTTRDVMRNFNKRLANNEKYTGIMLPSKEGMTIARKEF